MSKVVHSTGTKGALNELRAVIWLLARGYDVYRNVSPSGMADLVASRFGSGELLFIDVKQGAIRKAGTLTYPNLKKAQVSAGIRLLVVTDNWIGWPHDFDGSLKWTAEYERAAKPMPSKAISQDKKDCLLVNFRKGMSIARLMKQNELSRGQVWAVINGVAP